MSKYSYEANFRETLDIVRRMAGLAEYQKPDVKSHLERVRGYCYILAEGLGLPENDAMIISIASQLHDIGEIGVPKTVLAKTGELSAYEWEQIRKHPLVGAEILKGSSSIVLQTAEMIALTHHERWDGSGYPRGLHGQDIPLGGRICALADVFDALTTPRAYKKEVDVHEALALIQEASEQLFDPSLVKVFSEKFAEILRVRETYLGERDLSGLRVPSA